MGGCVLHVTVDAGRHDGGCVPSMERHDGGHVRSMARLGAPYIFIKLFIKYLFAAKLYLIKMFSFQIYY